MVDYFAQYPPMQGYDFDIYDGARYLIKTNNGMVFKANVSEDMGMLTFTNPQILVNGTQPYSQTLFRTNITRAIELPTRAASMHSMAEGLRDGINWNQGGRKKSKRKSRKSKSKRKSRKNKRKSKKSKRTTNRYRK